MKIELITTKELEQKLANIHLLKLIMTYHTSGYESMHIPGSINLNTLENAAQIGKNQEIIVYCINENCQASVQAYFFLKKNGYKNVKRYAGGIEAWEKAGLSLAGKDAERINDVPIIITPSK